MKNCFVIALTILSIVSLSSCSSHIIAKKCKQVVDDEETFVCEQEGWLE